jgi:hypothetical protein
MTVRSRRQFVLELERKGQPQPAIQTSPELVQALADLLMEALGRETNDKASAKGVRNESKNHA